MNYLNANRIIWERSHFLSRAYWAQYQKLIGPFSRVVSEESSLTDQEELEGSDCDDTSVESEGEVELEEEIQYGKEIVSEEDPDIAIDVNFESEEDSETGAVGQEEVINQEYLEFIKITRQHQEERDKLKLLEQTKRSDLDLEEYYKDISQVNTLIEDNLAEAPDKKNLHQLSSVERQEEKLIKLYGGREAYEKIRSMEMSIDEHFNEKLQELNPRYWPVMPLNPKPYLNPIK